MRKFDHMGLPTDDRQPREMYVPASKVWVTDPADHPYRVEFLRYEPDSPVTGPVRNRPHIAFEVEDLEAELADGAEVLLGPFQATDELRVVFVLKDGAVFEYMKNSGPGSWFKG